VRLLVVDDSPDIQAAVCRVIQNALGYGSVSMPQTVERPWM